ncbi:Aminodeoxychorismate lyase [hydrothermal vent metagenome]|uniref:Aminodeoxychorismate lyase n=1 Tax=hydrothermal vent metagenome TaxID=652676 RepID=A0A3B0TLA6_9ZZZZ
MSPLLETIKLEDGKLFNLEYHNRRLNKARRDYFGLKEEIALEGIITITEEYKTGLYRCRVIYSPEIERVEFVRHQYREVKSLMLVEGNSVDYRFKYTDRKQLLKLFGRRGGCDDILIVQNGCITDSSTANIIFFDGAKWWTPDTPLLPGTQRERLLEEGEIFECRITPGDLNKYINAGLINAMQDLKSMPVVLMENIVSSK